MTTTREAALEAALKLARNRLQACAIDYPTGSREMAERSEWADEATAALYTPATEPQGYVARISDAMEDGKGFWRSCSGCHELNEGHPTGDYSAVFRCHLGCGCHECGGIGAVWDTTDYDDMGDFLAARPAPQPAAEHEYPDPLIAEDRYEDDQPAADTPAMNDELATMISDLSHTGELSMPYRLEIADRITALRAIIGTATTSDKIAEAAIDRCMQEIEDIICEADVSYPAGRDAGTSIDFDRDAVLAALRALAGKGE